MITPRLIFTGALLSLLSTPSVALNLVPNGDFEKQDDGILAAWMPQSTILDTVPNNVNGISTGFADIIWDTESVDGGHGSLLVRGRENRHTNQETNTLLFSPKIPVKENTQYKVSYFLKGYGFMAAPGGLYCQANLILQYFAGNGHPGYANYWYGRLVNGYDKERDTVLQEVSPAQDHANSDNWQKTEFTITTPAKTTDLRIAIRVTCANALHPYSVWFDNISIEPAGSAPAPIPAPLTPTSVPVDAAFSAPAMSPETDWKDRSLPPHPARGLETGDINFPPPIIPYGSRIQRTMKLLATSTPEHRNRVNILIYGQSIVADSRDQAMRLFIDDLRKKYPYADIVTENLALGGFMSDILKLTAGRDFSSTYPDLVIMHDYSYGDNNAEKRANTEAMYAYLHDNTTAEMLTLTHHVSHTGNPYDKPPYSFYTGNRTNLDNDSNLIRSLADKYGYEVADMRKDWTQFLIDSRPAAAADLNALRMHAMDYLQDVVHQNPRGGLLMERIVMKHFQYNPQQAIDWLDRVKVYSGDGKRWQQNRDEYPTSGEIMNKPLNFSFEGNRIDLLGMPVPGKPGSAKILIDGKAPSSFPTVYIATRSTPKPGAAWPMVYHIQLGPNPVAEGWTLTYTKVTPAKSRPDIAEPDTFDFEFQLKGSVTGLDGKGNNKEKFVSNSGRIVLDPKWYLPQFVQAGYMPPVGFEVKWQVFPQALDLWQQNANVDPTLEDRYTLAQGLPNGKHTVQIIPNGDGPLGLRAIVVYQPEQPLPDLPCPPQASATIPLPPQAPVSGKEWTNSQGVKFVPAGTDGVLFSIWDVRVKDYQAFVEANPGYDAGTNWNQPGWAQTPDCPVTQVNWFDAHVFCNWLTKKEQAEGKLAAYQYYRLPTDAEWSQAINLQESTTGTPGDKDGKIRGLYMWSTTQWPPPAGAGNFLGSNDTGAKVSPNWPSIAGYNDGFAHTSPVGSFPANSHGLYDMAGNVWQWCEDRYDLVQRARVLRGGSWNHGFPENLLASSRDQAAPVHRADDYGFRCVLVCDPPKKVK